MGKGDKKTRRGKLFSGSYGVLRPRKRKPSFSTVTTTKKVVASEEKAHTEKPKPKNPKVETAVPIIKESAVEQDKAVHMEKTAVEEKKPVAKKPAATKTAVKKPAAKKTTAKKTTAKKTTAKKTNAKKPAVKKPKAEDKKDKE